MTELRKKWDMFMESVSMSLSNITGNKMRTFLTTLGIIIGVAAIIALMTVVQGATDTMTAQFDSMGLGTLRISITGTAIKRGLTDAEVAKLLECDNVAGVSPSLSATVTTFTARCRLPLRWRRSARRSRATASRSPSPAPAL